MKEFLQPWGVDRVRFGIGREQDVGFEQDFAGGHDIARIRPLQRDAGEGEMRRRGADVDADAEQLDFVFVDDAAPRVGEKQPASRVRLGTREAGGLGPVLCRGVPSMRR